jgi:NAD dependent epimerase/dehydratase family enzyme
MNILITGATGFVGRRLCEMLHQAGHTVRALSRDSVAAKQRVPHLKEVFPWNPLQELPPLQAFEGCDAVINLAGESIAGRWTSP